MLEWLRLQAFLFFPSLEHSHINLLAPIASAAALTAALCGTSKVIPLDVSVPGYPPAPIAILQDILTAIRKRNAT